MSTYKEREAKRRAKEGRPLLMLGESLLAAMALGAAFSLSEAVVDAIWPTRYEAGVTAWGETRDGLRAGLEIDFFNEEASIMLCRLHLQNTGGETVTVDTTPMRRAGTDVRQGELVISDERRFQDAPRPSLTPLRPGKGTFHQEFVSLRRLFLLGRHRLDLSWVYRNDRSEHTRVSWSGRERRTETIEDIWTGEIRSGAVHMVTGWAWYAYVLYGCIVVGLFYLAKMMWSRLKRRLGIVPSSPPPPQESAEGE